MKCRYSENDVALFVEGDLPFVRAREFDAHLETCAACRELADGLRESQSAFKSLGEDMVSAAALAHVRTRVLAEVGSGRMKGGWGRWVYAVAGVAFVVVIGVGLGIYGRKAGEAKAREIVKVDPLPASPAVPLTRGTMNASPEPGRKPAVVKPSVVKHVVPSVPLPEGDSRRSRQGVAHTEIVDIPAPDPPKQIVVKLLTDNPNIVIYWLLDDKNGGTL